MVTEYETHPAADIFPLLKGKNFDNLVADIQAHRLRDPIVLYEGKILDGRNRYRACQQLGIEPRVVKRDDIGDPWDFVLSANLHRRQLTKSQIAMVLARYEARPTWRDPIKGRFSSERSSVTAGELAKSRGVDPSLVRKAKTVRREAPDLVSEVDQGKITVSAAHREVKHRKQKLTPEHQVNGPAQKPHTDRELEQLILSDKSLSLRQMSTRYHTRHQRVCRVYHALADRGLVPDRRGNNQPVGWVAPIRGAKYFDKTLIPDLDMTLSLLIDGILNRMPSENHEMLLDPQTEGEEDAKQLFLNKLKKIQKSANRIITKYTSASNVIAFHKAAG